MSSTSIGLELDNDENEIEIPKLKMSKNNKLLLWNSQKFMKFKGIKHMSP